MTMNFFNNATYGIIINFITHLCSERDLISQFVVELWAEGRLVAVAEGPVVHAWAGVVGEPVGARTVGGCGEGEEELNKVAR